MSDFPKLCNKCGRSCLVYTSMCDASNFSLDLSYDATYGSYALADGLRYKFTLCEGCLAEIIKSLIITPRVVDWLGSSLIHGTYLVSDEHLPQDREPEYWYPDWETHPADKGPPKLSPEELGFGCGLPVASGESLPRDPTQHGYTEGTEEWNQWLIGYDQALTYVESQDEL